MDIKPVTAFPDAAPTEEFWAAVECALLVAAIMEVSLARIVEAFDRRDYNALIGALDAGRDLLVKYGDHTRQEQVN
jgi:hypothetical protein